MTCTSTRRGSSEPTRCTSPSSSTRSSLACTVSGSSPISSRNSVPPSASLEQPRLVVGGAGERAAHVPEQLALEQRLDDRRAVDGDEAPVAARAGAMQRARDELLAGAGLAGDRARCARAAPAGGSAEQLLHQRPAADHAAELQPPARGRARSTARCAGARSRRARSSSSCSQPREVERLAQVVHRARA